MEFKYDFEKAKEKYRKLCETEADICIYMKDWYLDAVTENSDDWRVILLEENDEIVAAFPFGYRKRKGMYYIEAPWQCARMGMWIKQQSYESKQSEMLQLEQYVQKILEKLPRYDVFRIPFNSSFENWQPFYWNGFSEQTNYSMVIDSNKEDYYEDISKKRQKRIRRGLRKYSVELNKFSLDEYWCFLEKTYQSREKKLSYDENRFKKLISVLQKKGACAIHSVLDENNEVVAANIILEDNMRCYHQFGCQMQGQDGDSKSLAVYESINYAIRSGKKFDFEGSMIHGVCEFNSSFNPKWEPYHLITKYSRRYRIISNIFMVFKDLIRNRD